MSEQIQLLKYSKKLFNEKKNMHIFKQVDVIRQH